MTFNEPTIYFYLIDFKFLSKYRLKNKNEGNHVGRYSRY